MSNPSFSRGGFRIELDKEPNFFTTIIEDESTLEKVRNIAGVEGLSKIHGRSFRVKVDPSKLDEAMDEVRSDKVKGVCHHAYHPLNDNTTRYYLTDQILLKFERGTSIASKEEIIAKHFLKFTKKIGNPDTYLLQVTKSTGMNPIKCCGQLNGYDEISYAEPNLINRFQNQNRPSDELFSQQWHLDANEDVQLVSGADVGALEAWETTKGSRQVVVSVIDDGFDLSHPDLSGEGKIIAPKDFIDGDTRPFPETAAGDYHGTPCAGVAIGEENGEGIVGIAPNCAWQPIRFNLAAEDHELWEIFDFASKNSDVISCSWGPVPVFAPLSQLLYDKMTEIATTGGRRGKGAVIMFSAGNYNAPLYAPDNESFDWFVPMYGLQRTQGPILNGNASHPEVMAIASSTSLNTKAAYSNWGAEISVAAPSNNFHPIDSQIWVPGRGIWTTDNDQQGQDFTPNSRYTGRFGGTSSACPLAAGVAALVISANPKLSGKQVRQILEETADKIEDLNPDPVLGLQKGTYDAQGHSEWFGFGKVNAARAVKRALEVEVEEPEPEPNEGSKVFTGNLTKDGAEEIFAFMATADFEVILEGPEGVDFDLYVRMDLPPTATQYDRRSTDLGPEEIISFSNATEGIYYILVKSYRGSGPFRVEVKGLN